MCAAIVVAFAVMVAVECVLCNMPFWRSLAASGDSAAAYNVLGPGLERTDEGLLKVTDPTQAYMQVDAGWLVGICSYGPGVFEGVG